MKQVIAQALDLAADEKSMLNTGHLLLAMMGGSGTVTKLFQLRGLTRPKIRNQLKEMEPEPHSVIGHSIEKARQIAAPFNSNEPSPLHLLAAVVSMRDSIAFHALESLGMNTTTIRTQALRCLTGVTEAHGAGVHQVAQLPERHGALPVAEQLKSFSSQASTEELLPVSERPSAVIKPLPKDYIAPSGHGARRLIDMGRELEIKQRKKRVSQSVPSFEGNSSAREDLPLETTREIPIMDLPHIAETVVPDNERPGQSPNEMEEYPGELPADQFPLLSTLGRNLSALAAQDQLDRIVGRDREMERIADVLNKRRANSPCIVGPAGVGKTALIEGLAARLAAGEAPGLHGRVIIEIRPADLLAGTSVRGALSERLRQLVEEVGQSSGRVVLFFDEFHTILATNDGAEAIQELTTSLGRGELPCIAATTDTEYSNTIQTNPALARRFTPIEIAEPCEKEAIEILEGVAPAYSDHHGVAFTKEAIEAAVKLSARYVSDRALPDKAIALMDLAGARARREDEAEVAAIRVASVLAEQLDVPLERLAVTNLERLLNLELELSADIVGHKHVLVAIGETLRRNAAGFRDGRPIGSFLFLGPTGVGKTETAKALSKFLFPGVHAMVRLDMSEFSEAHAVARLIGAPPGYVGHEEGGQLTEAVRRRPYTLVLLDEIEKAHPDVHKVLLQVLEDGRLTDGLGHTVVFENTVVIMTSNLGSDLRKLRRNVGFGAKEASVPDNINDTILSGARSALPPELWNRIDEPMVFMPLSREEVAVIATRMLQRISDQLQKEHGVSLSIDQDAIGLLVESGGFDPELGARPMRRTIQRLIEGPVARMVLTKATKPGEVIRIAEHQGELRFEPETVS